jgi:hypothetical protein
MSSIKISIINESTVVSDHEVIAATADLQIQVSRDFAGMAKKRKALLALGPLSKSACE